MDRPMRLCDVCGQLDDHPRHVIAHHPQSTDGTQSADVVIPPGQSIPTAALLEFGRPNVSVRHMDCCASQGCEICAQTEQEYGTRRGQALIDHLEQVRTSD